MIKDLAEDVICATCGTPIFIVEDGEASDGPIWAHAEEIHCDDPVPTLGEPAEPEGLVSVVEPVVPRRRRPPAALLLALGGLSHPGLDLPPILLSRRTPAPQPPQPPRGPGAAPARELPEADKARRAAAEAKRARRAEKARKDAERSTQGQQRKKA